MRRRWITRSLYSAKISCVLLSPTSSSFSPLYCYQTDTPPYINATHDEMKEYMRLLGKIKYELMNPVSDTYNIIVSLLYYLLLIINRTYAAAYCLPAEIAKNNFAFRFKDLLEQNIRTHQRVQEYADMLHVSRITLNNSVKAQFGVSATHLIKQRLLEELKNELLFSNRTVSEMADDSISLIRAISCASSNSKQAKHLLST